MKKPTEKQKMKNKGWWKYWGGSWEEPENDAVRMMRLSSIRKGVANFVRVLTDRIIPVKFSSGSQSKTDGRNIVIISAETDPEYFDVMVGVAIHEAAHVVRSQPLFDFLEVLQSNPDNIIPVEVYDRGKELGRSKKDVRDDLHHMINFLEDRKIDQWTYQKAPGYRPYIEARYEHHFYSPWIDKALTSKKFRQPYIRCYELHIINMFSDKATPDALPGLRKIWEIINLRHIDRYDNDTRWGDWPKWRWEKTISEKDREDFPLIIADAFEMLGIVYSNSVLAPVEDNDMNQTTEAEYDSDDVDDLDNYDDCPGMSGEGEGEEGAAEAH